MSDDIQKNKNIPVDPSYLIKPETPISDIVEVYPDVVEFLIDEYEFFCMSCIMAEWETLEEGAHNHGIIGVDFKQLLDEVNKIVLGDK